MNLVSLCCNAMNISPCWTRAPAFPLEPDVKNNKQWISQDKRYEGSWQAKSTRTAEESKISGMNESYFGIWQKNIISLYVKKDYLYFNSYLLSSRSWIFLFIQSGTVLIIYTNLKIILQSSQLNTQTVRRSGHTLSVSERVQSPYLLRFHQMTRDKPGWDQ